MFADEQNSFWKGRSCIDHIFVLSSIIHNRKAKGLSTYIVYIEFEKAFDRIDRKLFFHKCMSIGIRGKILDCIKSIYEDGKAGVIVNGHITDCFCIHFGHTLSPTLFGLFINDLVSALKTNTKGIDLETFIIQCLLYADDLVLIAESEEDRQFMWDKSLCKHNWSYQIKQLFSNNGFENTFMTNSCVNVKLMHDHDAFHQWVCSTWNQDIFYVDKLRTYVTFKEEYGTEHYGKVVSNRQHIAALSQLRCCVLTLKVEIGKFQDIPVEYKLYTMCEENVIET